MVPERAERCLRIRRGNSDLSPVNCWLAPNRHKSIAQATNKPITSAEAQDFVCPPHCKARNKLMQAAKKRRVPIQSICLSRWRAGKDLTSSCEVLGLTSSSTMMRAITPIGTFLVVSVWCKETIEKGSSHPKAPAPCYFVSKYSSYDGWCASANSLNA